MGGIGYLGVVFACAALAGTVSGLLMDDSETKNKLGVIILFAFLLALPVIPYV